MALTTGFEKYRRREFLGDALLFFILKEYLFERFPNHTRTYLGGITSTLCDNYSLYKIGESIGIEIYQDEDSPKEWRSTKAYANAVEVRVYDTFVSDGYVKAKQWVIENIIPYHSKRLEAIECLMPVNEIKTRVL